MTDVHSSRPDSIGAVAPGTEIEITPEMIEAGFEQIYEHAHPAMEPTSEEMRLAVVEIYRAMFGTQSKFLPLTRERG